MTHVNDSLGTLRAALANRYRVERELGAGGMATVYLARDLKHERDVAIKVLKPELAAVLGAERFVVEIKTTAALQHPHILPLFDSGEANGFLYYVMPFVDGETLRARLDRETQLGVDEAVRLATDVADALQYAHTHGVIHRDIKPENILLANGRPMVADFGIALAVSAAAGGRMTETGLSLGTPHYMSPEQATAEKEIGARSDVYSLASVLYEMLAGQPPHLGGSAQQIIMKIITETAAPVTTLRRSVSPHVSAALAKALEKLPADRFDSAKAFAEALANPAFTTMVAAPGRGALGTSGWKQRLAVPLAAGLALSLAALAWAVARSASAPTAAPVLRTLLTLPDSAPVMSQDGSLFAMSKDGSRFVYVGPGVGDRALWWRPWNALTATPIPGSLGADSPFLSANGETVAYYLGGQNGLYTVSMRGGARQTIALDSTVALGGDFGPDGAIYFSRVDGIRRVPHGSGAVEPVTSVNTKAGEMRHGWVDVLPNGKGALLTIVYGDGAVDAERSQIAVVNFATHEVTPLFRGARAQYSPSGHIVYSDAGGGLYAIAFDQRTRTTSGSPIAIVPPRGGNAGDAIQFAISATGVLVYQSAGARRTEKLVWVDRRGQEQVIDSTITGPFNDLALSPDGTRLAVTQEGKEGPDIWIKDLGTNGAVSRLTTAGNDWGPAWTSDGRGIMYVHATSRTRDLMRRRADGGDTAVVVLHAARRIDYGVPSADGAWIAYVGAPILSTTGRDLYAHRMSGDTTTIPIAPSAKAEAMPSLSPDGRWIAYASNQSGAWEVFVSPFPDVQSARIQVTLDGGMRPMWSADGRELFYVRGDRRLTAARLDVSGAPRVLDRQALFDVSTYNGDPFYGPTYAVSRDGRRFVMSRVTERGSASLVLVENWASELPGGRQP